MEVGGFLIVSGQVAANPNNPQQTSFKVIKSAGVSLLSVDKSGNIFIPNNLYVNGITQS